MANISLRNLRKIYKTQKKQTFEAVKKINLDIDNRDFVVFVGPSGCGKTTTLRMIAGLEEITEGEIYIEDNLINDVEPKDRNIAMVFQNYALYPHMSVYDNIAFGLKNRKVEKTIIEKKVKAAANVLGLEEELKRKPKELSGGQRQRVAMGRAIVREPKVFLMDEPLSNLDAKLRVQMRNELVKLHKEFDATFVYVTHDQVEAMTLANKIVVMDKGHIMQVDTPDRIFNHPENMFVAGFIGSPQMNFINGKFENGYFVSNEGKVLLESKLFAKNPKDGQAIVLGVRPEHWEIKQDNDSIKAKVDHLENMGSYQNIYCEVGEEKLTIQSNTEEKFRYGQCIYLKPNKEKIHVFDKLSEQNILK